MPPIYLGENMNNDLFMVKRYIVANSPDELIRLQVKNNIDRGITFKYEIVFADSKWFAWYLDSVQDIVKTSVTRELKRA